jgi:large repetitive protein
VSGDPMLATLGSYGGPTQTMIPLPGSSAICAGAVSNIPSGLTTDQRGYARSTTYDTACVDAGAVQTNYSLSLAAPAPVSPATAIVAGTAFTDTATLNESGSAFSGASATLPALTFTGTGTLSGSASVTTQATNGTATYTGLSISSPGSGDVLTVTLPLNSSLSTAPSITASTSSFTVNSPLSLSPASGTLTSGQVAAVYGGVTFTTTGGSGSYSYAVTSGSLPTGLSLTNGVLQGTPIVSGNFSFTITTTDQDSPASTDSAVYSLAITAPSLSLATSTLTSATYNTAYNASALQSIPTATGGVGPYTYALASDSALPAGLSLSSAGVITGTPTANAGSYSFTVVATDTGSTDSSDNHYTVSQSYSLTVNQATATVALTNLAQTYNGSALSATATTTPANLTVGLTYSGSTIAPTAAGSYTVLATINDTNYSGTATGTLVISKAATTVSTWPTATGITYGSALSSSTLSGGSASPTGTFAWTTSSTIPNAGTASYGVTFTPTDTANYTTESGSVSVTVSKATPAITWATPAAITYGAALSSTQLDATANVAGSFVYIPAAGTILNAGTSTLSLTFTPTDTANYSGVTQTVSQTVNQATPTIAWATPTTITYGTALSSTQLNATANVAGSFVYIPAAGAILGIGTNTLLVTFAPTDATNYSSVTQTVLLTVTSSTTTTISSLSPANASAEGAAFTLTVTGKNFTSGSVVYWGSTALTTTYVSATQLTAAVTASQIASSGIVAISVLGSDGTFSSTLMFEIDSTASTAPMFTTTTVTVTAGSTATYAVTLPSTATIVSVTCLNLPAGASCSYSSTAKAVTITTSTATPTGSYLVTIVINETATSTTTASILLPILLLPLLLMRRKLAARGAWFTACLAVILLAGSIFATGCGGTSRSTTTTQTTSSGVVTLVVK